MSNVIEKYLKTNWHKIESKGIIPDKLTLMKVSGQNFSTAAVNFFLFVEDEKRPSYFLKINRKPKEFNNIEEEFSSLKQVSGFLSSDISHTFPEPVFLGKVDDLTTLMVQTFLNGRKIYLNNYKELSELFAKSFHWLKCFYNVTRKGVTKFDSLKLKDAFVEVEKIQAPPRAIKEKLDMVIKIADEFNGLNIPLSSSQGDFDFDNILINDSGISIVDWEDYNENSHPLLDLEFFIFNLGLYYYEKDPHIESLDKFFSKGTKTYNLADRYITEYCNFLKLEKPVFYLVAIRDTIDIIKNGYGNHKCVPMQSAYFLGALIQLSLREIGQGA